MQTACIPSQDCSHKTNTTLPKRKDPARTVTGLSLRSDPKLANQPCADHRRAITAERPRNSRQVRMAASAGVAMATHRAMRAGNGSDTAARITRQIAASQPPASKAARLDGMRSIRLQDGATDGRVTGVWGNIARYQIADQVGIGQLEKFDEGGALITCRGFVVLTQVPKKQHIQLFHSAPAAPLQPADFSAAVQSSSS